MKRLIITILVMAFSVSLISRPVGDEAVKMETLIEVPGNPWGMAFLPDTSILITERSGTLYFYDLNSSSELIEVNGLPDIISKGQSGILDIVAHPDYRKNNLIFFTATTGTRKEFSTALFKAKFQGGTLKHVEKLFQAKDFNMDSKRHFGSRIVIDEKGFIFVSLGERGKDPEYSQDLSFHNGKIIRIHQDGTIPKDNPFVNTVGAQPEIWSYGHRNVQGMAIHPETGEIWIHEHGPRGGDEINIIQKGANYGWPLATFGIDYDGTIISRDTSIAGAVDPIYYWVPSIAPCGMNFYSSDKIPQYKGSLFLGALAGKHLNRLTVKGNEVVSEDRLFQGFARFRQVIQGPDGYIYFITERPGQLCRIVPAK